MANHAYYEKRRWGELHMVILDDDGIARIAESLQSLKSKMDDEFYKKEENFTKNSIAPVNPTNTP